MFLKNRKTNSSGFTIVELLIVVVVIAILAAITIVAYNGVSSNAKETAIKSQLSQANKKLETYKTLDTNASYPTSYTQAGLTEPAETTYAYSGGGSAYCLQATRDTLNFYVTNTSGGPVEGSCPVVAVAMQTITNANCTTTRTLTFDARDNRTYWVQRLADGRCWMLTNLAYAGGGTNTHGDVKALSDRTGMGADVTIASYYIPTGSNPTTLPAQPSLSTDGGATARQYGYLYNWCGARGSQTGSAACLNATSPIPTSASVCPANWRLPSGNTSGELGALNAALNGGNGYAPDANLRSAWLMQRSGYLSYMGAFYSQDGSGMFWSSTQASSTDAYYLTASNSDSLYESSIQKRSGLAVRCTAS